jgi:hypothetical protein
MMEPEDLFSTGNDIDNRAAVKKVNTEDLALVGIAAAGDRRDVDKALDNSPCILNRRQLLLLPMREAFSGASLAGSRMPWMS